MKTINPKNFFAEIIEKYKEGHKGYGNSYDKKVAVFEKCILKIQNKYSSLFGEDILETEIFQENIEKMKSFFWAENTPFGNGSCNINLEFFQENCIGIFDIYEDVRDDIIDFDLSYNGNPIYYNLNFLLQNYCFDFITRDFE